MNIQFAATGDSPDYYTIEGEEINGIDLSPLDHGGRFGGNGATRNAGIRDAYRDSDGILHVTLCQRVIAYQYPGREGRSHWRAGPEIEATDYDPNQCYVVPTGASDLIEGVDYKIVWAQGRAQGEEGWTIQPVENDDA